MIADGLTKRLSAEKYTAFVRQLGIEILPAERVDESDDT